MTDLLTLQSTWSRPHVVMRVTAALLSHTQVVGGYFNIVCSCGYRGTTVSRNGDLEKHQAEEILKALEPTQAMCKHCNAHIKRADPDHSWVHMDDRVSCDYMDYIAQPKEES